VVTIRGAFGLVVLEFQSLLRIGALHEYNQTARTIAAAPNNATESPVLISMKFSALMSMS